MLGKVCCIFLLVLEDNMIHVVCVKWGDLYSSEYVNNLYEGVKVNTTLDFEFICFTENSKGVNEEIFCRTLPNNGLQGWWNKMYLFSNDIGITDRIFYFDLDTVIVGNIDEIMKFDGEFAILRDFYRARRNPQARDYGSGLMAWKGGWGHNIWSDFYANKEKNTKIGAGDQKYLMNVIPSDKVTYWQDFVPGQVISYKAHVRDEGVKDQIPDNARIICFHGKPRPHEVRNLDWMKQHWKHV